MQIPRLGLRTRTAVSELVREHYGLDKSSSPGFVYDDDGNDIGIVFLLNGRLHFLPRDSDTPTELPEDILPKRIPMKNIKNGEGNGEAKGERVKIRKIVTDTNSPHVAVEWELPSEIGQILLLKICLEAALDGVDPVFVQVINTGRDQASNQFLPEAKQSKHFVGGFDNTSRLIYYRLDDERIDDSWRVERVGVDAHVEQIGGAGYYPEHLGVVDDRAVWSNRHARWRCGLNGAIPHRPYHRYREAGKDGQDLLVIRDDNDGHESVLGKVAFGDDEVEFTQISELSHEAQFVRNLPNPVPSGVITHVSVSPRHGWFVVFNDDHGATLARRVTEEDLQPIDLFAVEDECGGPVSIGAIASSHDRVAIQVSNFNRTNQIWVANLTKEGVGAFEALMPNLVHGVESFSIHFQVHSSPVQATDGTDIEFNWFDLSSDDVQPNGRTVVYIHGGPAVRLRLEHKADIASLVGEGFRVVAPNVPGSAGQGGWFAGLDDGVDARLALFETAWVPFLEELHAQDEPLCLYGGRCGVCDWKISPQIHIASCMQQSFETA